MCVFVVRINFRYFPKRLQSFGQFPLGLVEEREVVKRPRMMGLSCEHFFQLFFGVGIAL